MNTPSSFANVVYVENPMLKKVDQDLEKMVSEETEQLYANSVSNDYDDDQTFEEEQEEHAQKFDYKEALNDLRIEDNEDGEVMEFRIVYQVDFRNMWDIRVYKLNVEKFTVFTSSELYSYYEQYEYVPSNPKKIYNKGNVGRLEDGKYVYITCKNIYY
jgi:hypothetical protein